MQPMTILQKIYNTLQKNLTNKQMLKALKVGSMIRNMMGTGVDIKHCHSIRNIVSTWGLNY